MPRPPSAPGSPRAGRLALAPACVLAAVVGCAAPAPPGGAPAAPDDAPPAEAAVDPAAGRSTDTLLAVNGTRLFVRRIGAGEPILVVHGGPVLDHGYLVEPLRPLAGEHELVFFDQRLSGRSAGTVDSASVRLDTFVADIEAIRAALDLGRVHVLGHSWGGLLAAKYAIRHPDRVRSLVLVSPMPHTTGLWQEEQAAQAAAMQPADTAGTGALRASEAFHAREPAAVERMLRMSFRGALHDRTLADSLHFHVEPDYAERSRQFGHMLPELLDYDLTEGLSRLDVPTLVVYGAIEPGAEIGGDTLTALLPRGRLEVIEETGHFSFMERPEAFLEVVRAFLEEQAGRMMRR